MNNFKNTESLDLLDTFDMLMTFDDHTATEKLEFCNAIALIMTTFKLTCMRYNERGFDKTPEDLITLSESQKLADAFLTLYAYADKHGLGRLVPAIQPKTINGINGSVYKLSLFCREILNNLQNHSDDGRTDGGHITNLVDTIL